MAEPNGRSHSSQTQDDAPADADERTIGERAGHLFGSLDLPEPTDEWSRQIRERNWRS